MSLELSSGCGTENDIIIKNMNNEIDINSCHDIKLTDITGPLVL